MTEKHTTALGIEPFDQVYSLGYQVNHDDWSPFPRVNRLRQTFSTVPMRSTLSVCVWSLRPIRSTRTRPASCSAPMPLRMSCSIPACISMTRT